MMSDPANSGPPVAVSSSDTLENLLDLISPALIRPDRLSEPLGWIEHIPFAGWIMAQHRPRVLVELGTHTGNSYLAFCQAVSTFGLPTRCFAIETWEGDEHTGHYGEEAYQALSQYHDQHYGGFSRLVRLRFDDALEHFPDHSIDLLHIDGLQDAVAHDYHRSVNKMSDRGIILLHDVRENDSGVFRAWEELRGRFPHFEFRHGHGLGVLGVGPNVGPQLKALFAARLKSQSCHHVRRTFAQLGHALTVQEALNEERKRLQDSLDHYQELTTRYEAMAARAAALESAHLHPLQSGTVSAETHAGPDTPAPAPWANLHYDILDTLLAWSLRARRALMRRLKPKIATAIRWARARAARAAGGPRRFGRSVSTILQFLAPSVHRRFRRVVSDPPILFDRNWYVFRHPDVAASGIDPFTHYVHFGIAKGYDPNPLFDTDWYLAQNPDVAAAGVNPLIHYVSDGAARGRDPNPYFDTDWYAAQNGDVVSGGMKSAPSLFPGRGGERMRSEPELRHEMVS